MSKTKMLIEESGGRVKVALLHDNVLVDYTEEETERGQLKGNIYKGVVARVEPSLQAAFIDLGEDRHGFIQIKDIHPRNYPEGIKPSDRPPIQDVLKRKQTVLVQVTRDPLDSKGADLTTHISLAGRYVVLMPDEEGSGGISRRIETSEDRARLRDLVSNLSVPKNCSVIVRTVGKASTKREIDRDLARLVRLWQKISAQFASDPAPSLLFSEEDAAFRALRDYLTPDVDEVVLGSEHVAARVKTYVRTVMPRAKVAFSVHQKQTPLMVDSGIERLVLACLQPEVPLPSGGSLVIQVTTALVAVDVNSGKSTKGSGSEQTALSTNIEAAKELARQLRLRDLGGLIVVDFIDMADEKHRAEVERQLRTAMKDDKARIRLGHISAFGMLELSRQRLRRSLISLRTSPCPRCGGRGRIIDPVQRATQALQLLENVPERRDVTLEVDPDTALLLMNQHRVLISHLEQSRGLRVRIALATAAEVEPKVRDAKMRRDEPPRREREPEHTEDHGGLPRKPESPHRHAVEPNREQGGSSVDSSGQVRPPRRRRRKRRPASLPVLEETLEKPVVTGQPPQEQTVGAKDEGAVRGILKRILPRRRSG
ncbi:Rne/Rng family ribonuclease [Candidatus Fermentibacteria bacterium]|nr:Rne/Rng family ribonuclease [Candidatus Fermentibacteria bacterium]